MMFMGGSSILQGTNSGIRDVKTLADLSVNESGIIEHITRGNDNKINRRLLELGFVNGEKVKVLNMSILKEVLLVEICGFVLSIRKDVAKRIIITREKQ